MAASFLSTRSALPEITGDSTAVEIKRHITEMKNDLITSPRNGSQNRLVHLMPDVFSWTGEAQKEGQESRPADHDDDEWKTIGDFFAEALPNRLNVAFFSTYYAEGAATEPFQAHAWIGLAAQFDYAPGGWLTAVWDPNWMTFGEEDGPNPQFPGEPTLDKISTVLPNMAFFLTRAGRSTVEPLFYGGGNPNSVDREPGDCVKTCLMWLRQVCRGELTITDEQADAAGGFTDTSVQLTVGNLPLIGFFRIGQVNPLRDHLPASINPQRAPLWVRN